MSKRTKKRYSVNIIEMDTGHSITFDDILAYNENDARLIADCIYQEGRPGFHGCIYYNVEKMKECGE